MRAAVVGGGAYAMGKRRARIEQEDADAAYQEGAASVPETDPYEELAKLGQLRDQGVLTEAEFEVQKARILRNA
jgi:hypothetical protein